jgi:hypothetical protein
MWLCRPTPMAFSPRLTRHSRLAIGPQPGLPTPRRSRSQSRPRRYSAWETHCGLIEDAERLVKRVGQVVATHAVA